MFVLVAINCIARLFCNESRRARGLTACAWTDGVRASRLTTRAHRLMTRARGSHGIVNYPGIVLYTSGTYICAAAAEVSSFLVHRLSDSRLIIISKHSIT